VILLQAAVAAGGAGASPFKALKSIQLCSTITVRGAFSSDVRFGLQVCLFALEGHVAV
jgi:hypothetical protein